MSLPKKDMHHLLTEHATSKNEMASAHPCFQKKGLVKFPFMVFKSVTMTHDANVRQQTLASPMFRRQVKRFNSLCTSTVLNIDYTSQLFTTLQSIVIQEP